MSGGAGLVNLRIAGKLIPINAGPNTTINLLNLGLITINQQIVDTHQPEPGGQREAIRGPGIKRY